MKYTIDGPEMGFEAFIEGERQIVATLVHLPEASAKTAAMFGRHAARSWLDQPEYASFSEDNNSRVVRWDGSTLDIKTKKELEDITVGYLKMTRIIGEICGHGKVWVVDDVKVAKHYEK